MVKMKNKFPSYFIQKCHELYPTFTSLHIQLKKNNFREVGKFLENTIKFTLDENDIITYFKNKKEKEILRIAELTTKRRLLFNEYLDIINEVEEKSLE